ncbi:SKP1-like protein 1B [Tanacetum coccineum]
MESCVMNNWIQYEFDGALAFKFTSEILSKVIEFCKKHAETRKTNEKHAHEKKLMDFNSQFLKQNQSHLINLLHAACRLQRSLLDVTSEAVVDMIIGKTLKIFTRCST